MNMILASFVYTSALGLGFFRYHDLTAITSLFVFYQHDKITVLCFIGYFTV